MQLTLPKLNYAYEALEPIFDALTMEIHHSKHHQAYLDNFNKVLAKYPDLTGTPEELMANFNNLPLAEEDKTPFKNFGGGYLNHNIFWHSIDPANIPDENLRQEIINEFESLDKFKELFTKTAMGQFGSGWAWLVRNKEGKLNVYSTPNQDSPLLKGDQPIFCLDVWEHAYYLKYQNKRADFVSAFWQVLKLI